jgi:hypothetical protein
VVLIHSGMQGDTTRLLSVILESLNITTVTNGCRSQWPPDLRRRSAAAHPLRLWVRIPPGSGCLTTVSFVCCQVQVYADHSSRGVLLTAVRRCVWATNLLNEEVLAHWVMLNQIKKKIGLYAAHIWVCSTMAILIVNKVGNVVYVYLILRHLALPWKLARYFIFVEPQSISSCLGYKSWDITADEFHLAPEEIDFTANLCRCEPY